MESNLDPHAVSPEALARFFHEEYERLAPEHGYETRKESAVPWVEVPEPNRKLMVAVADSVLQRFFPDRASFSNEVETVDGEV